MWLKNRVVLITGAARGIGQACAVAMARQGADVGLFDLDKNVQDTAHAVEEIGCRAVWAAVDVSDPEQVRKGVEIVRRNIGDIECLVNNAGIVNNISPIEKMAQTAWEREISVNLTGAFNMIRTVIGPMAQKGWGRIINMASGAARGGLFNQSGYSASKSGLLGLTRNVTLEYARRGITCNAVLPGLIGTENVLAMPKAITDHIVSVTPAHRIGTPGEVACLVAFLCSDEAGFINGAEIDIDGGARLNSAAIGSIKENMPNF
ncbi:MAG: SDR family NAD(P)-dependent oxidoreductase [Desulfocucumaceae bacterium]